MDFRWTGILSLGLLFGWLNPAIAAPPARAGATSAQIASSIRELDADEFWTREEATARLIEVGEAGIEPLRRALKEGSLEVKTRVLYIFQELALSDDEAVEDAARTALEAVAKPQETAIAQQAAALLAGINDQRKERAAEQLQKVGAKIEETVRAAIGGLGGELGQTIEIGEDWKGTLRDLKKIKWLGDSSAIKLILRGEQVTDEWLETIEGATGVQALLLKRTRTTPQGLKVVKSFPRLQEVSVYYSPLEDRALAVLAECPQLVMVKLYGTKVTKAAADKLQNALKAGLVDLRSGGFLGIGCQDTVEGCQVYLVQDDSAAKEAGIQQGDIIASLAGKPVTEFKSLTAIISDYSAGDEIEVVLQRNDERVTKKIKLGEWQ
jgi:hypothetical protein